MIAWWQSLSTLEHVLLYIAIPATLILLLQTLLLFLGGVTGSGSDGVDLDGDGIPDAGGLDLDGDGIPDVDGLDLDGDGVPDDLEGAHQDGPAAGLHLFTVRGIIAFLTLFGWGSLCFLQIGLPPALAVFLGIPVGLAGMVGTALILREAMKLQYDGTLQVRNAVGLRGYVYLTIPPCRSAPGKVNVMVQEQLREFEAVTDRTAPIPTGSPVRVTGLTEGNILLVEMEEENPAENKK